MSHQLIRDGSAWNAETIRLINHALSTALNEGAPNSQTGASYTFAPADARRLNVFDRATAQTVTIPTNANVAFPIGTVLRCVRKGAGLVTIAPDTGVTLNKPTGIRPNRFMGAMVRKTSDQTGANYTVFPTTVAWDSEVHDSDAFHDTSTNNERLTIPSNLGIKKVTLKCQLRLQNHTANVYSDFVIRKGGAVAFDGAAASIYDGPLTTHLGGAVSIAVPVADADYFDTVLFVETDTSIDVIAAESSFSIEATAIDAQGTITYQHGEVALVKISTNEWTITGSGLG